MVRGAAVLTRHRVERTADLVALAAAEQIGRSADPCRAATRIARSNKVELLRCEVNLDASRRSGDVLVTVSVTSGMPIVGARNV